MNELAAAFDLANHPYHVFGDGVMGPGKGAPTNLYVTDPTGDSIQIDGIWSSVPTGGSGDSLMDACSQVDLCAAFVSEL